jgi:peroxiredoxin Q/BCP
MTLTKPLATVLVMLLTATVSFAADVKPPAVGDKAPGLELKTLSDESVSLAAMREKGPVVVIVLRGWVGYQCPVCTKQVGDFIKHSKQLDDAGAQMVLVYPGQGDDLKKHAADFEKGEEHPRALHAGG